MTDKPLKLVFAPGCFDSFDGTQEELDNLVSKIQEMVDTGEFTKHAVPAEDIPPEVLAKFEALGDDFSEEDFEKFDDQYKKKLN